MLQKKILQKLEENQKSIKVGDEVFNVAISENDIKRGKPIQDIVAEMKKASKEHLIKGDANASFC